MKDSLEKLADKGVKRLKFYYKKSRLIGNICTVCLLLSEDDELLARGVAICSLRDSHNKATGKNIALGRATKALKNQRNSEEINPDREKLMNYITIKKINTKDPYYNEILDEASDNGFVMEIIENKSKGEEYLKIEIPLDVPLYETFKLFSYKSEYRPDPTDEEKKIIGKRLDK